MRIAALVALAALPAFAQAEGKGKTEVTWYGHAAFVIKTPGGTTLAVDPWISNPSNKDKAALEKIEKVDYILLSHGHSDHVGDTVALQKKTNAKIVAAFELGVQLAAAGVPKEAAGVQTPGDAGGGPKDTGEGGGGVGATGGRLGFPGREEAPL